MVRLVILEGVDRSGKSTLADVLARALGARRVSFPARSDPRMAGVDFALLATDDAVFSRFCDLCSTQMLEFVESLDSENQETLVIDRFWPSNVAYAKARGVAFDHGRIEAVQKRHAQVCVFLDVDPKDLAGTRPALDGLDADGGLQERVYAAYCSLAAPEWIRLTDVQRKTPECLAREVVEEIYRRC
jgi:thymidylate kinase